MRMIDLITLAQDCGRCAGWVDNQYCFHITSADVTIQGLQKSNSALQEELKKRDKAMEEVVKIVDSVTNHLEDVTNFMKELKFIPGIQKVAFDKNNETTVIIWDDGKKTVVRNTSGAPADRYAGFCAAVCKRLFGSTTNTIKELDEHDVNLIAQKKKAQREDLEVKSKEILAAWKEKAAKEKRRAFDKMVDEEVLRERARRKAIHILNKEAQKTDDRK